MAAVIDSDQHLFESRSLWADHIDPDLADEALAIVDDAVADAEAGAVVEVVVEPEAAGADA